LTAKTRSLAIPTHYLKLTDTMRTIQEVLPEMGSASRQSPKFLAQKLSTIRKSIGGGLSQEEMVSRLGLTGEIDRTYISRYEAGLLEPPLGVLLRYAEVAGLHLEALADDDLLLPDKLPCVPKSEGIRQKKSSRGKKN
jgi:transcriptional regulator with XRE-family HTH domain